MKKTGLALAIVAMMLALPLHAQEKKARWEPTARQQEVLSSHSFLEAHPDMLNRARAMEELKRGDDTRAAAYFRRAARYADKASQAGYAEMLWEGRGVERDRALAYAWMDLAAERGYELFLAFRERYWAELGEAERVRAVEVGQQVYAEFGDTVAKPRLEAVMRRASRNITGSRTGAVGALKIVIPGPGGGTVIDGTEFYDKQFWEPKRYWQWQAAVMDGVKEGRVIVGDLHRKPDEAGDGAADKPGPDGKKGD